jgi:predicted nuclease of predicted toxin-antitoxin system
VNDGSPFCRNMKLLFDQNLSWRLPKKLADLYPDSQHIREVGMKESQDVDIWNYAKANGFVIATKDLDFQQRSLLFGHPPKVVRLRVGNCTVQTIEDLLRRHSAVIHTFELEPVMNYERKAQRHF